jgi:hypothetical protein
MVLFPLLRQGDSFFWDPRSVAAFYCFTLGNRTLEMSQKKRGCVVLDHTTSNSSKALLGILTARGQEIYISD